MTHCSECPALKGYQCHPIHGDGPNPCRFLFIGAGPGKNEHLRDEVYAGKAGDELNYTYLPLAGLSRDRVHVTNASLCWDGSARIPSEDRVRCCAANHLPAVLDRVQPEVVVLMGGVTQWIADRRLRLDVFHGRPVWGSLLNKTWEGWIYPVNEPALGMREGRQMSPLLEDFRRLREWINGDWTPPEPPKKKTDYRLIETHDQLTDYLVSATMNPRRFKGGIPIDTERHGPDPWSVQLSFVPGTGRMIRTDNKTVLEALAWQTAQWNIILHNAGQDQDILDQLKLPWLSFRDTQQEAFHQCSLPQGLKPLVYRFFGFEMTSWEETVWPASINAVVDWMGDAILLAQTNLSDSLVTEMKTVRCLECGHKAHDHKAKCGSKAGGGNCQCTSIGRLSNRKTETKAGAVESILRHVLRYVGSTQDADEPYNPWKAIPKMREEGLRGKKAEPWEWQYLESELGPLPILGIGNCEIGQAVEYGCGDADWTGQVAVELERGQSDQRWIVPEEDWDQ